jgi:uncharacterized protein
MDFVTSPTCRRMAIVALTLLLTLSALPQEESEAEKHAEWVRANYTKFEYRVPMRDGTKLFTTVYRPNWSQEAFPIILSRTPYSAGPYGANKFKGMLGPHREFDKEGFIFLFQDVRGRFLSEGTYVNMRPHTDAINESQDAYDTIDWAVKTLPRNNARVGQWGVSYPGFYTACSIISNHPALKVASPQAPIADWFWDDMHHNGAFSLQLAFNFFSIFGVKSDGPHEKWPDAFEHKTPDGYQFFLDLGPLKNVNKRHFKGEIDFWNKLTQHPNYDEFWQSRNLLPHLRNVGCTVLTVGGWYDAEDLYGPLQIYSGVEKNNPGAINTLVMGPWFHGGWIRGKGDRLGDTPFDFPTAKYFQQHVMLPLFLEKLKDGPPAGLPEALVFETGANRWRRFSTWPPKVEPKELFLGSQGSLSFSAKGEAGAASFVSDPAHPVPSTAEISIQRRREMMSEDQRFAARRPDVLTFQTDVLQDDVTLAGPLEMELFVSTDKTAADWVVKLIDVYPGDEPERKVDGEKFSLGHAQLLVRYEILRGRFRNSFQKPEPFKPNEVTRVPIKLFDVCHTFERGHRIMIQVQSSYFPFFDRNPQTYVENIFEATQGDFVKANHKVWYGAEHPSRLKVGVLRDAGI